MTAEVISRAVTQVRSSSSQTTLPELAPRLKQAGTIALDPQRVSTMVKMTASDVVCTDAIMRKLLLSLLVVFRGVASIWREDCQTLLLSCGRHSGISNVDNQCLRALSRYVLVILNYTWYYSALL